MDANTQLNQRRLADAWAELHNDAHQGNPLHADAHRMAFVDPEFMFRRETRGIRFQLEMLKPDLGQEEQGIESTVVVYGSARFVSPKQAAKQLTQRIKEKANAHLLAQAERAVRNAKYYEQSRKFAKLVAEHSKRQKPENRLYICTGGGPGIMEAANRGAHDAGALNIGLSIALPHEQAGNRYISPSLSFKFHYFALRKMHFMIRAKALVAFPGGFGTLDELFEVLTLVQTKKAKPVPIVLFGSDYWKRLINWELLVEEGTISSQDLKLFHILDDADEAWNLIRAFYQLGR